MDAETPSKAVASETVAGTPSVTDAGPLSFGGSPTKAGQQSGLEAGSGTQSVTDADPRSSDAGPQSDLDVGSAWSTGLPVSIAAWQARQMKRFELLPRP